MGLGWPALAGPALVALLAGVAVDAADPVPYRDLSTQGAGFLGPGREEQPPDTLSVVRVGLSGPSTTPSGLDLQAGVSLAIAQANLAGGYQGLPYQVEFLADDGPWGRVAAQVISLIQERQAWAVIASLDGERAHAAELVAAKLWTSVLTPGAGDRTVDYANVPWVFRLMPDDRSQADLLVASAVERGWRRLVLVTEGTRDGRVASERVREATGAAGLSLALSQEFTPADADGITSRVAMMGADAVILWARPASGAAFAARLRQRGCLVPLLVPAPMVCPEVAAAVDSLGPVLGAAPLDLWSGDPQVVAFRQAYQQATGRQASPVAAYAYEAACVVIAAIERAGLNRARIRDQIAATCLEGLTGTVTFDGLGGYQRQPVLVEARKGGWVRR